MVVFLPIGKNGKPVKVYCDNILVDPANVTLFYTLANNSKIFACPSWELLRYVVRAETVRIRAKNLRPYDCMVAKLGNGESAFYRVLHVNKKADYNNSKWLVDVDLGRRGLLSDGEELIFSQDQWVLVKRGTNPQGTTFDWDEPLPPAPVEVPLPPLPPLPTHPWNMPLDRQPATSMSANWLEDLYANIANGFVDAAARTASPPIQPATEPRRPTIDRAPQTYVCPSSFLVLLGHRPANRGR